MPQIYRRGSDSAPLPVLLFDPGYPTSSVGEGITILEMRLSESGNTDAVRVIRDTPGLAAHTEKVAENLEVSTGDAKRLCYDWKRHCRRLVSSSDYL